jgi:Ca2+-binding EF-hand superfamily protein
MPHMSLTALSRSGSSLDALPPFQQQVRLRDVFTQFDTTGEGTLSRDAMAALLRQLVPHAPEASIQNMQALVDVDGDGTIAYPELIANIKEYTAVQVRSTFPALPLL